MEPNSPFPRVRASSTLPPSGNPLPDTQLHLCGHPLKERLLTQVTHVMERLHLVLSGNHHEYIKFPCFLSSDPSGPQLDIAIDWSATTEDKPPSLDALPPDLSPNAKHRPGSEEEQGFNSQKTTKGKMY